MNIQSIVKRTLLAVGVIGAASLAAVPTVSARVHGAGLGRAVFAADQHCFNLFFNGITNTCSGSARTFEVPLPVDTFTQPKSVTFTGNGATCTAHASDSHFNVLSSGSTVTLNTGSTPDTRTSTATVPSGGRLWLTCSLDTNERVLNINYTQ
jgi:lysozyme family protein